MNRASAPIGANVWKTGTQAGTVEEHPEWRYDTGSGLEKAFHRAERSLAGPQIEITAYDLKAGKVLTQKTARPLSVFYDPYSQEAARAISRMNTQASAALAGNEEAQREEIAAWQQTDPELAEALLASFQFDAETEELLARAQAGDAAAGEEAYNRVYMQRGYWPAEELRKRLPQTHHDPGDWDVLRTQTIAKCSDSPWVSKLEHSRRP